MAVNVALQRTDVLRAPREGAATETQTTRPLKARSKERRFVTSARGSFVQVCGVGGYRALHLDSQTGTGNCTMLQALPSPIKLDDLTSGDGPGLRQGIWEELCTMKVVNETTE